MALIIGIFLPEIGSAMLPREEPSRPAPAQGTAPPSDGTTELIKWLVIIFLLVAAGGFVIAFYTNPY